MEILSPKINIEGNWEPNLFINIKLIRKIKASIRDVTNRGGVGCP